MKKIKLNVIAKTIVNVKYLQRHLESNLEYERIDKTHKFCAINLIESN